MKKLITRDNLYGILFILPALVFFTIFSIYPIFNTFRLSLTSWNFIDQPQFQGLSNFKMLFSDGKFIQSLKVTVYYTIVVCPGQWIVGLFLALLLNRRIKLKGFYQICYFLPFILSGVVVSIVWRYIYQPRIGLYRIFTDPLGIGQIRWLIDSRWAIPALVILGVWKSAGYYMLLFLSQLQTIPEIFYEAAMIDGASRWKRFRFITLPLLKPIFLFVVIISIIQAFQVFAPAFLMTAGGPAGATRVLPLYIYEVAFRYMKIGYACSIAIVMFAMLITMTLIQLRLLGSKDP